MTEQDIYSWLREVVHPGKGDRDIVSLGMVDGIEVSDGGRRVSIVLGFANHKDPLEDYLLGAARAAVFRHAPEGVEVSSKAVIRDKAKPKQMNSVKELGLDAVNNVRHIIGVASGKGGVGKSTVAVDLAIALSKLGYKVGLADADVYGPSVPLMTGTEGHSPDLKEKEDGKQMMLPVEKFGVKWMSIGYFAQPGQALIWRGPMASNALKQMILQVEWGILDYLLIDMPPGTGDIHISLVQEIPMEGALVVTTPQAVALSDVEKSINMFANENIHKKVFGIVENMSWFTPAELPDNKYYIFGKGGGAALAERHHVPLLGQIPIVQSVREGGDVGAPVALGEGVMSDAFRSLARSLADIAG